jgi:hypothetical protein
VKLICSALADNNHLGRLVELRGRSCGDDLELANRIERRNLAFAALKSHFLIRDSVQRGPKASIRIGVPVPIDGVTPLTAS